MKFSRNVTMRFTPEEKWDLDVEATKRKISISDLLRERLGFRPINDFKPKEEVNNAFHQPHEFNK